ncbi:MAG: hypothetical protein SWX82_23415 [Cyanobacteriota bacterium]|nr:hypothetical protein [Cyanobacteriota bacterium]
MYINLSQVTEVQSFFFFFIPYSLLPTPYSLLPKTNKFCTKKSGLKTPLSRG